jgi:phage terminase large subunit-like protein
LRGVLPAGSPPRFPRALPRGPELWDVGNTKWTEANTDGAWVCDFTQATIRLTKGANRGQLVRLRHWQGDLICDVLRKNRSGQRLYRTYEIFMSRKNSKSLLGAAFALDGLFDEAGAEVYSCAGDKEQAKLVFREVVEAVAMSPELGGPTGKKGLLTVYRDAIEYPQLGSVYRVVSSESRLREGMNPSRVLFDEKHVQKNDDLWNVMNQGSDTRDQPLTVTLTTKGVLTYTDGTPTVCKRGYDYAKKVMAGEIDDPTYGCRIYETTGENKAGFNYLDERNWYPSNPALGDFLHLDHMRTRSRQMPENDFKTKRLNIWVVHRRSWLPGGAFEKLGRPGRLPIPGEPAVLALDGSFDQDSTALIAWLFGTDMPHLTAVGVW